MSVNGIMPISDFHWQWDSENELESCEGCFGNFDTAQLNDDGLCEACEYELEAKLDALTCEVA